MRTVPGGSESQSREAARPCVTGGKSRRVGGRPGEKLRCCQLSVHAKPKEETVHTLSPHIEKKRHNAAAQHRTQTNTNTTHNTRPDQTRPDQTRPDQTRPDQTRPDQTRPDQTRPDQTRPDQTRPDPAENTVRGWAPMFTRRFQQCKRLTPSCALIVLKCLYLASIERPDVLWTVSVLTRSIIK